MSEREWPTWLDRTGTKVAVVLLDGIDEDDSIVGTVKHGDATAIGLVITPEGSKRERFVPWTAIRWVDRMVGR